MTVNATVVLVPLIPNAVLPQPATARTRVAVPSGYGVQEQCLPFTAASALGFVVPSPIRWGFCLPSKAPPGCHVFRSPLDRPVHGQFGDERVFYVLDDPNCRFRGNAYEFEGIPSGARLSTVQEPGISFFDRQDQQDLFKLHLPYLWRTPDSIDVLFLPLLNRSAQGVSVLSGLVETDWYPSPVNLILGKPPGSVHFQPGDPVAHAILIPRPFRRPTLEIAPDHARLSRDVRKGLSEWDKQHAENRGAYKALARSRHGRIEAE